MKYVTVLYIQNNLVVSFNLLIITFNNKKKYQIIT